MRKFENFVNVILYGGITLCGAILFYVLFISATSLIERTVYGVMAISGGVFFGFGLRWRTETKINVVIALFSIVIVLYVLEIALLVTLDDDIFEQRIRAAEEAGVPFDSRSRFNLVRDLQAEGSDVYFGINPAEYIASNGLPIHEPYLYPLSLIANRPSTVCNETGEWTIIEHDEHGFNNPKGLFQNQETKIVLIGDSFTYGLCVGQGKDIGASLRQHGWKVVNLGVPGQGPLGELGVLKEYGEPLSPEIVLWLYFEGNDLANLIEEVKSPRLLQYLDKNFSQDLIGQQEAVDQLLDQYIEYRDQAFNQWLAERETQIFLRAIKLRYLVIKSVTQIIEEFESVGCRQELTLFTEVLSEAKERVNSQNEQFVFVYLPSWERYGIIDHQKDLHCRDEVLSVVDGLEIPLIDFHDILSNHPDPMSLFPFRINGHYNAEGYGLLGTQIDTYLDANLPE